MRTKLTTWLTRMMIAAVLLSPLVALEARADAYCSGLVSQIIVISDGVVQVKHTGSHASNWVSVSTAAGSDATQRMYSLLVSAWLAGKQVELKFSGSYTCGSIPQYTQFSYVRTL